MVTIKITNFGAKMMDFSILEILDNFWRGKKNNFMQDLVGALLKTYTPRRISHEECI